MKHDTSSPTEEATEWVTGIGREVWPSMDFVPSYVVKNAPDDGMVARITLPMPWYKPRKRDRLMVLVEGFV